MFVFFSVKSSHQLRNYLNLHLRAFVCRICLLSLEVFVGMSALLLEIVKNEPIMCLPQRPTSYIVQNSFEILNETYLSSYIYIQYLYDGML